MRGCSEAAGFPNYLILLVVRRTSNLIPNPFPIVLASLRWQAAEPSGKGLNRRIAETVDFDFVEIRHDSAKFMQA